MPSVSIRVLEGLEQGRVFSRLPLPVSVGREEENTIQLNDDRISRLHAKMQYQAGRVILTDLGSTNGTRVNGRPVTRCIVQAGDVIAIGRCLLLLSERVEDDQMATLEDTSRKIPPKVEKDGVTVDEMEDANDDIIPPPSNYEQTEMFPNGRPELPTQLNALQQIQLSDFLSFVHERIGKVVKEGVEDLDVTSNRMITCDWETWSHLVALQSELAECLCKINNPT